MTRGGSMRYWVIGLLAVLWVPAAMCLAQEAGEERSIYGGYPAIQGRKTGFFHTERINGRWMLVDPEGCGYLAVGMTGCSIYPGGRGRGWDGQTPELQQMQGVLKSRYPTTAQWGGARRSG